MTYIYYTERKRMGCRHTEKKREGEDEEIEERQRGRCRERERERESESERIARAPKKITGPREKAKRSKWQ